MIQFFVPGKPIPQARPRTFIHKQSGRYVTMNPKESEVWKKTVATVALRCRPQEPITVPVKVEMDFRFPEPKKKRNQLWHVSRPDLDNLIKGILDAVMMAGILKDDSFVTWLDCKKRLTSRKLPLGVVVQISKL